MLISKIKIYYLQNQWLEEDAAGRMYFQKCKRSSVL